MHAPSDAIAAADPTWGATVLGDKGHSMIFDNTKVKRLVPDYVATIPYSRGAREIIDWYDADLPAGGRRGDECHYGQARGQPPDRRELAPEVGAAQALFSRRSRFASFSRGSRVGRADSFTTSALMIIWATSSPAWHVVHDVEQDLLENRP